MLNKLLAVDLAAVEGTSTRRKPTPLEDPKKACFLGDVKSTLLT